MLKKFGLFQVIGTLFITRVIVELIMQLSYSMDISWVSFIAKNVWTAGELILFGCVLDILLRFQFLQKFVRLILVLAFIFFISWTVTDPIVISLAGDHLTPSLLSHFAGPKIFVGDELWLPIKKHWIKIVAGLAVGALLIAYFMRLIKSKVNNNQKLSPAQFIALGVVGLILIVLPSKVQGRFLQYPGEALYVRNWLGWDVFQEKPENIAKLQAFLRLPSTPQATYPLLEEIKGKPDSHPNIILFVIESLRAQEISTFHEDGELHMDALDRFANRGILFKSFISNGYPSTEGFLSLAMGVWPHSKERMVISRQDKAMPSVARSLGENGYQTYRIEDWTDRDEEGFYVRKTFSDWVNFFVEGHIPSEKNMVDTLMGIMKHHERNGVPYYVHLKTRNPHYPYQTTDEEDDKFYEAGTTIKENYYSSLAVMNKNLNRLYDFMERNELFENTLVIITGDHSNILSRLHFSALPFNETVWTGAIIAGDSSLIGPPRVDNRHASQVDLPATILKLTQGNKEWVGFGNDLFQESGSKYTVAVRPAGVRLDYKGYSFIVDRTRPYDYIIKPAFPHLSPDEEPTPPVSSLELLDIVDTYTYLIENNRIYYPD